MREWNRGILGVLRYKVESELANTIHKERQQPPFPKKKPAGCRRIDKSGFGINSLKLEKYEI